MFALCKLAVKGSSFARQGRIKGLSDEHVDGRKETHCEFCDGMLPDWKAVLTPTCGANAPAVMNVNFDGRTYSFEVKPGEDGYRRFTEAIRRAFALPEDSELNITFTCDEPCSGQPDLKARRSRSSGAIMPYTSIL